MKDGYCVVLDEKGKQLDSMGFSSLLKSKSRINFFIGGAYGFGDKIKQKANVVVSLSRLTMPHKLAYVVLLEQIYRGFTIISHHPYHK
jgi:23S rRNA (pseudouridine1915-N3)-methyltransferase